MVEDTGMSPEEAKLIGAIEEDIIDTLGQKVMNDFGEASDAREDGGQDDIFVKAHRHVKGVYPSGFIPSGESAAFAKLTRPRVAHAVARIMESIAPVGEDAVTFDPTPEPKMPKLASQLAAQGIPQPDIEKAVKISCDMAASRLTIKSKDGMAEDRWNEKLHDFTWNMCHYGTGIMIGPLAAPAKSTVSTALRMLDEDDEVRPEFRSVFPPAFYPAPGATDVESLPWAIEYSCVDKTLLKDWSKQEKFFKTSVIEDILEKKPDGTWEPEQWELDILGANNNDETGPNGKYGLYVWWGWLSGEDLRSADFDVPDELMHDQVMTQLWVISGRVISIRVSKLHRDRLPFYVVPYSKVPKSIWGCGVAECMFDSQEAYNALERALYDNLAWSVKPYGLIAAYRLLNPSDAKSLNPGFKLAIKQNELPGSTEKPIMFDTIPSQLNEIQAKQSQILMLIQDQTGIPNVLLGQGGEGIHNRTSQGAAMQFGNAMTPLKGVVMNVENGLMVPAMTKLVEFYYMFSNDESIKGDIKVNARGVSGLIARENLVNRINALGSVGAQMPELGKRIDPERVASALFRGSGLEQERLTFTDTEFAKIQEQQAQMEANKELAMAEGKANIETQATKLRAETSPTDILLQIMEASPEGSAVRIRTQKKLLEVKGMLDEELAGALDHDLEIALAKGLGEALMQDASLETMRKKQQGGSVEAE